VLSGAVALIAAVTKFTAGAWISVVLIPVIVAVCLRVHRYYALAREQLTPDARADTAIAGADDTAETGRVVTGPERQCAPDEVQHLVVVPVAVLDLPALRALAYAASLAVPVLAVHVSPSEQEADRFRRYWQIWGDHLPLEVVVSPYRATPAPLANYIEALHLERPDITLSVVVPQLIPRRYWQRLLHNRTGQRLRRMLTSYEGVVIIEVPFHLR
jgi:hypothetical protein